MAFVSPDPALDQRGLARQAGISAEQVEVSRAALEAQSRPVLIDFAPGSSDGREELVPYGSGADRNVPISDVHLGDSDTGYFIFSIPLRNAGLGLAVLKDDPRLTHPSRDADYIGKFTKQLVPPGEAMRA